MKRECIDKMAGKILAGWRYDISGITPEMRGDYVRHFAECDYCRAKRHLHRTIDIALILLASLSAILFLLAFGVIHHFEPRHAFLLELAALAGFALSMLVWLVIALATPAPVVITDATRVGVRIVHDRLPENIRERIPEELRLKISKS